MWVDTGCGLGRLVARGLAERGWSVIVTHPDADTIASLRAETGGGRSCAVVADISSSSAAERVVEEIGRTFGPIYALINVAAACPELPALEVEEAQWRHTVEATVTRCFLRSQAAARVMVAGGSGRIVNVISVNAERGVPGMAVLAATHSSVASMTRVFAVELASRGLTVNAISLGPMEACLPAASGPIPAGRTGAARDCLGVVEFLLSEEAEWLTGEVLHVDGGFNAAALVVERGRA